MERNLAAEIDALKEQMAALQTALQTLAGHSVAKGDSRPTVGHVEKMPGMHPDERISSLVSDLEDACGADGSTGRITYVGVFASGGRQSTWVKNDVNTDGLLSLIENHTVETMLSCIGSNARLSLLLTLLRKPRTVAELVSECGFSSTGQVYHHLKPLIAADLVTEDKAHKGSYIVQPHRVQGVIMLLAGVSDLVDGTYTQGIIG